MIHWYTFYLLCIVAALGVFAPSVRRLSVCMVAACMAGYVAVNITEGDRVGFWWAFLDLSIAYWFLHKFNCKKSELISLIFGGLAAAHGFMTIAVIEQERTFIYNNYELIVAFFNLSHVLVLLHGAYHDFIRYFNDMLNNWRRTQYHMAFIQDKDAAQK